CQKPLFLRIFSRIPSRLTMIPDTVGCTTPPCRCIYLPGRYSRWKPTVAPGRRARGPPAPDADMTLQVHSPPELFDTLAYAREIVREEAAALLKVAERLDGSFGAAVELIRRCPGRVCVTGTGKSADVGQKIAGTLNSTGTRAYVLDVTRAAHG